jgi:hypothetical protein
VVILALISGLGQKISKNRNRFLSKKLVFEINFFKIKNQPWSQIFQIWERKNSDKNVQIMSIFLSEGPMTKKIIKPLVPKSLFFSPIFLA